MSDASSLKDIQPRKKMSILIVQMGEIEEIFRSLMAMKAIKHLYPEMEMSVVTRAEASSPLKRVSFIDHVIEVPKVRGNGDAVTQVATWIGKIVDRNYDFLANWTSGKLHSRKAAIVSTLIPAMVKVGDYLRDDSTQGSYDAWSMYREAWLKDETIDQDIHFTDLITTQLLTVLQIHAGDPSPDVGAAAVTSKFFFDVKSESLPDCFRVRAKGFKWIAIHPSSLSDRASEWVDMVLRRHPDYAIVVFGKPGEILTNAVNPRVIFLNDELHFDSLVAVLSQCSWLMCGKHAIADLASLLSVRIFYSPEQNEREFALKWSETGPYGNGHVVIASQSEWKPELAYAAWSYYQGEWFHQYSLTLTGHFDNLGVVTGLEEVQVYKSRIRPASEGGGVCYERTAGVSREFEAWMYRVRGQMARAWFCGWLPSVDQEVAKLSLNPALIKKIRSVHESIQILEKLAGQGRALAVELHQVASKTRGHLMSVEERDHIESFGKRILDVEALMSRVIMVEPELRCLLKWYQQLMHNLQGETIAAMAKETVQGFDLLEEGIELISVYTKKTLDTAKPKAVRTHTPTLSLPS
jgi:ADP-heptose:LPS heptosyltransferase